MLTTEQKERLDWIEHVLKDADAGRLLTGAQFAQMEEEREHLLELDKADANQN